jgi:hypothetical protein
MEPVDPPTVRALVRLVAQPLSPRLRPIALPSMSLYRMGVQVF